MEAWTFKIFENCQPEKRHITLAQAVNKLHLSADKALGLIEQVCKTVNNGGQFFKNPSRSYEPHDENIKITISRARAQSFCSPIR